MGLFGKWSRKRDRRDEKRMEDFNALLDRIERERFQPREEAAPQEPAEKTPEDPGTRPD